MGTMMSTSTGTAGGAADEADGVDGDDENTDCDVHGGINDDIDIGGVEDVVEDVVVVKAVPQVVPV